MQSVRLLPKQRGAGRRVNPARFPGGKRQELGHVSVKKGVPFSTSPGGGVPQGMGFVALQRTGNEKPGFADDEAPSLHGGANLDSTSSLAPKSFPGFPKAEIQKKYNPPL